MTEKKRTVYLDVLRIIACLCVIYNHSYEYGFSMYGERALGSAQYFVELFCSMSCKLAVPVFFALSGALLLGRKVSLRRIWLEKIPHIAFLLLAFNTLYYFREVSAGRADWGLKVYLFGLYEKSWGYHLWYLYAYIAFLIALPTLSALAQALDDRTLVYLLVAAIVVRCGIPGVEAFRWENTHRLNPNFDLSFLTSDIVLYPLMGYYLHARASRRTLRRAFPVLCVLSVLLTAVSCSMAYRDYFKTWSTYSQAYHNLFAPFLCATTFCGARLLFERIDADSRAGRILTEIGISTFGIYLIHLMYMEDLSGLFGLFEWIRQGTGVLPLLGSLLYCLTMMALSLIPVLILRRIPVLRRLVT